MKTDFLVALEQLLQRTRGKIDHILLETTGLADPGPILTALWADEQLEAGVFLDGVVTVVDAAHWRRCLPDTAAGEPDNEFLAQLAHADVVLLGLRGNDPGEEHEYAERMASMLEGLPTVLFVRNAGEFRGQLLGNTEDNHPVRNV